MHTDKKQILIVTSEFPPQPGGIGNHAYNLALYMSKQNYPVIVIADQRSLRGKEEDVFDGKLPFTVIRIKRYQLRLIMYLKRIVATGKHFKNTSNVIATGKFSLWNVSFLSFFFKTKTIAVIHGSEVNFKSSLLKKSINFSLKRMNDIVAVSNYTKSLIAYLNLNVEVIPNGINLDTWKLENVPDKTIIGNPVLTTVGRVSTRKGQLNVIQQLPDLIKQFPKIHYHCVGIPTETKKFIKIAKQLQVQKHITFHGSLNALYLKQILNKTDIFVMLSKESKTGDVEGFGIAILEANALSIPAIGSLGCGIEDAIHDNVSGILIETNNGNQFKRAIQDILDNKTSYKKEAKNWAEKHDWSNIIKRYIALLK